MFIPSIKGQENTSQLDEGKNILLYISVFIFNTLSICLSTRSLD